MGLIMSVDDDKIIRNLIRDIFENEELKIVSASNSFEAMEIAISNPVEVAILDIDLPHMTGFELQQRLHEIDPSIKIIFLSSRMNRNTLLQAMRNGAVDFHKKPLIADELVKSVKKHLSPVKIQSFRKAI